MRLWSCQGKDVTRWFPDLAAALAKQVPPGCVIDGEALIWAGDRLDLNSLQQRKDLAWLPVILSSQCRPRWAASFQTPSAGISSRSVIPFRQSGVSTGSPQ